MGWCWDQSYLPQISTRYLICPHQCPKKKQNQNQTVERDISYSEQMIPFVLTSCNTLCMNNTFLQRMPEKSRFWNTSGIIICLVKKWKVSDKLQFSKQNCYDVFMKDYKNLHSCSLSYSYWNFFFSPKLCTNCIGTGIGKDHLLHLVKYIATEYGMPSLKANGAH